MMVCENELDVIIEIYTQEITNILNLTLVCSSYINIVLCAWNLNNENVEYKFLSSSTSLRPFTCHILFVIVVISVIRGSLLDISQFFFCLHL